MPGAERADGGRQSDSTWTGHSRLTHARLPVVGRVRMRLRPGAFVCAALILMTAPARATVLPPGFADSLVTGGLQNPTAMVHSPDGRIFVAQQNGVVRVIEGGVL